MVVVMMYAMRTKMFAVILARPPGKCIANAFSLILCQPDKLRLATLALDVFKMSSLVLTGLLFLSGTKGKGRFTFLPVFS